MQQSNMHVSVNALTGDSPRAPTFRAPGIPTSNPSASNKIAK